VPRWSATPRRGAAGTRGRRPGRRGRRARATCRRASRPHPEPQHPGHRPLRPAEPRASRRRGRRRGRRCRGGRHRRADHPPRRPDGGVADRSPQRVGAASRGGGGREHPSEQVGVGAGCGHLGAAAGEVVVAPGAGHAAAVTGARRYASASSTWPGPIASTPSRSARVRATRSDRSKARADSPRAASPSASTRSAAGRAQRRIAALGAPATVVPGPKRAGRGLPCDGDPGCDRSGRLAVRGPDERRAVDGAELELEVEPVEQRTGQAAAVALHPVGTAGAGAGRVAEVTARAGVGRRDDERPSGVGDAGARPGDRDLAAFERLAERVEHPPRRLEQLVEQQQPPVRERELAGPGHAAAATDEPGRGDRVVRLAQRRHQGERVVGRTLPRERPHRRDLEGRGEVEVRQQPVEPPREHGLPAPRRAGQQQVVPASRGDLDHPDGRPAARAPRRGRAPPGHSGQARRGAMGRERRSPFSTSTSSAEVGGSGPPAAP
jgi:hypothetical protein